MNTLPAIISGEAAVRSDAAGYRSIFDAPADIRPDNIKTFMSGAVMVTRAVSALKAMGFRVGLIGKFGIGISGFSELFESTFKVKLQIDPVSEVVTVIGSDDIGFINTDTNAQLKPLLAGIAFFPPMKPFDFPEDPPAKTDAKYGGQTWYVYPHEIPAKLGKKSAWPTDEKLPVIVIDSGFYYRHPYFAKQEVLPARPRVESLEDEAWKQMEMYNGLNAGIERKLKVFQENPDPANEGDIEDLLFQKQGNLRALEDIRAYLDANPYVDTAGHGTAVLSNYLSIAPKSGVTVYREYSGLTLLHYFRRAREFAISLRRRGGAQPLLSLSSGGEITRDGSKQDKKFIGMMMAEITLAGMLEVLMVVSAGNVTGKTKIPVWNLHSYPIIVGGAHFDENDLLTASDTANGYLAAPDVNNRAVPDVCGLSGPGAKYLFVPTPPTPNSKAGDWSVAAGTSYATPQVAAICALIKKVCPAAAPAEIKEILMRTATPVAEGKTAQNEKLPDIKQTIANEQLPAGLVHIEKALWTAMFLGLNKLHNSNAAVKDAVADAERQIAAM